ncbi:bacteriocin immunity protein [Vibrio brasiliensis]|uniref:bacteriocin immunity protein n=1 Tax=Vibrio brasiliensis TaxID=170652 RepID=UPI001EFE893F|nr:bacteriocin immunity protein [Vibrio brasiliensis]MCG9749552.1 bacteriocin immunity protein [Vibrio brasiliensis]
MKNSLQEYTESELLGLLVKSEGIDFGEKELDELVDFFNEKIEHPSGSDLITPPTMLGIEDSSEAVIQELKRWYENKGIQCFKG